MASNSPTEDQPQENNDSSDFESFSDDLEDESQKIATQRAVFGSDSESDEDIASSPDTPKHHPTQHTAPSNDSENSQNEVPPSSTSNAQAPAVTNAALTDSSESDASPRSSDELFTDKQLKTPTAKPDVRSFSSDEPSSPEQEKPVGSVEADAETDAEEDGNEDDDEDHDTSETRISVDFPLIRADLGKEMHLVKMPNFLSVETRPFDPNFYEDELDEDEILDEEGRTRLKLKVENTIRWRTTKAAENAELVRESNARIVRWSDGSLSLHLGDEIFDIHKVDIHSDYNYLFIREGSGLQGQSSLQTKLTFRPHSTDSFTHRKITMSLADKTSKSHKVKILPVAGADPETNRLALVRKEEEKLRATLRRESQLRRMRERQAMSRGSMGSYAGERRHKRRADDDYEEEEDEDDDGNTTSLNALKRKAKSSLQASRKDVAAIYSDSESLSDISEPKRKVRARISDEEESD